MTHLSRENHHRLKMILSDLFEDAPPNPVME